MKALVIIPTHDRTEFVQEAVQSVFVQTRKADKVIVTGNVGLETVRELNVLSDAPLADRLNSAIESTDCDAFVMLSDDDTLAPTYLERTVAMMERLSVDIVYTDCMIFGAQTYNGTALGEWTKENIDSNTVPLVTSLCSKAAWRRAGGYAGVHFFDWDFWWRCFYTGATAHWLREPLWNYRRHNGQDSANCDMVGNRASALARFEQLRMEMA